MLPIARNYATFDIPRFVIVLVLLRLWQEPVAEKSASHQRVVTTGMVRNDARHKKQFEAQGGACLVIGGSARLARMMRAFATGPAMIWQRRAGAAHPTTDLARAAGGNPGVDPGVDLGGDLVADPLQPGAVRVALDAFDPTRRIDTVICLAGVIRGDAAALAVNSDLAVAALDLARDVGARRVILASSAAVYGAQSGVLGEACAVRPAAPYGVAKAQMEIAAQSWQAANAPQMEVCALRIGNVAGADALLGGGPRGAGERVLDIFADGQGPRRSYIGPRGFAQSMARVIAAPTLPPVLNLALPGVVSMDGLLRAAGIGFVARRAAPEAIASVELACDLAVQLGIVPRDRARAEAIIEDLRAYEAIR